MKKSSRIAAGLVAGLLALTPCVTCGLTAQAGSITIENAGANDVDHAYTAYQLITGTLSEDKSTLSNMAWGEGVDSAKLIAALKNAENAAALGITLGDDPDIKEVAEALGSISSDAAKVEKLAKIIDDAQILKTGTDLTKNASGNYETGTIADGWYLIKDNLEPDPAAEDGAVVSANLLQVTKNLTVKPKYSLPSLDKVIVEGEDEVKGNTASIGDTVTYKITTKVPNMTGYDKYFFNINDTLSSGLTFDPESVEIKVGSTVIKQDENDNYTDYETDHAMYYVTDSAVSGGTAIKIVFENFYENFKDTTAGTPITVTYNAVLNKDAVIDGAGNPNTASLTYSNNPNETGDGKSDDKPDEPGDDTPTGKTPDATVKTFTTEIVLDKFEKGKPETKLQGVRFRMTGTGLKSVLTDTGMYVKDDAADPAYYLLKDGSFTDEAKTGDATHDDAYASDDKYKFTTATDVTTEDVYVDVEGVTDENGALTFSGLNAGTYVITEIETLDGFNLLTAPITVTITAGTIPADLASCSFTYTPAELLDGNVVKIENSRGSTLPETGGIGTKLFYLIGGMLVVGSGVVLVTKKRMSRTEK